jgi:hypothetical protein
MAPAKRLPALVERSPLQPTRSVEAEAAGSVMLTAKAKTSAPSRKAESVLDEAEGE